ncbi:RAMP superfamily CRISPR-associated protein [Fusobacterium polymorphum]|mgnify:FL=1|uniref:CRISPR type III-associated protein domain-containing protein n=1 Tax=Fusobacterium nucleatum subsp. polymorphum TaxID=76857 RepID=A0A2C6BXX6_FUSNP|nr:RAMP superfamily CRISPR-associated protein [Fusobacterium polymorphum]PHI08954.1 hypothetical protein CA845_02230 [Fusobacterium polymorphum]PHI12452.1 hypothetical protein CBG59_00930 [Fusobacterium polymorphum]
MKEFLKLDNKLVIKLKIIPLSPLTIKYSSNDRNDEEKDDTYVAVITTEKNMRNEKDEKKPWKKLTIEKGSIKDEVRVGEIYIAGSTLKGLFRDRFLTSSKNNNEYVDNLFGFVEGDKAKKSRLFVQDAFLSDEKLRELFYANPKEALKQVTSLRAITPVDHFSSKAKVPLQYEYTMEKFVTELTINNASLKDLQALYFLIRDSINNEIRIGNSKTRGFGLVKFEIEDLKYEQFKSQNDELEIFEEYFNINDKESKKLGDKYINKSLHLKDDFKKVDLEKPNKFIVALFEMGVN